MTDRTRFQEAVRRVAAEREERRLDQVERARVLQEWGTTDPGERGHIRVLDLIGADTEPGLEAGDGFFIAHNVVVTEPWHESQVQRGERPRVQPATRNRTCEHCGFEFQGTTRTRFCQNACRQAAYRAR